MNGYQMLNEVCRLAKVRKLNGQPDRPSVGLLLLDGTTLIIDLPESLGSTRFLSCPNGMDEDNLIDYAAIMGIGVVWR